MRCGSVIQARSCEARALARVPPPLPPPDPRPACSTNRMCRPKKVWTLPGTHGHWSISRLQAASPEQASADLEAAFAVVLPVGQSVHERLCPPVDQLPLGQATLHTRSGSGTRARGERFKLEGMPLRALEGSCARLAGADA